MRSWPVSTEQDWTIGGLLDWTAGFLTKKGSEFPRLDAEVLLAHALGCPPRPAPRRRNVRFPVQHPAVHSPGRDDEVTGRGPRFRAALGPGRRPRRVPGLRAAHRPGGGTARSRRLPPRGDWRPAGAT